MNKRDAGSRGGQTTVRKYGKGYMAMIGRRGAATLHDRYSLQPIGLNNFALVNRQTGEIKATLVHMEAR
jgi:hypothetical protein